MKFIKIGFGNMVSSDRIIAIVGPDSSPVKRLIQDAKDRGALIDASSGRKTKSVLMMDSDHLVLSSLSVGELEKEIKDSKDIKDSNGIKDCKDNKDSKDSKESSEE